MANRSIPALKVQQWLRAWSDVKFSDRGHRREPEHHFYLFTLKASELKALSGIQRRTATSARIRTKSLGIQRRHDEKRSANISEFVRYGYPWSELSQERRESPDFHDLRKPGWLPTAVVVNILSPKDRRF